MMRSLRLILLLSLFAVASGALAQRAGIDDKRGIDDLSRAVIEGFVSQVRDDFGRPLFIVRGDRAELRQNGAKRVEGLNVRFLVYSSDAEDAKRRQELRLKAGLALWSETQESFDLSKDFTLSVVTFAGEDNTSNDNEVISASLSGTSANVDYKLNTGSISESDIEKRSQIELRDAIDVTFTGFDMTMQAPSLRLSVLLALARQTTTTASIAETDLSEAKYTLTNLSLSAPDGMVADLPKRFRLPESRIDLPTESRRDATLTPASSRFRLLTTGESSFRYDANQAAPNASMRLLGGVRLLEPGQLAPALACRDIVVKGNVLGTARLDELDKGAFTFVANELIATGNVDAGLLGFSGNSRRLTIELSNHEAAGTELLSSGYTYRFEDDASLSYLPRGERQPTSSLRELQIRAQSSVVLTQGAESWKISANERVFARFAVLEDDLRTRLEMNGEHVSVELDISRGEAVTTDSRGFASFESLSMRDLRAFAASGSGILPRFVLWRQRRKQMAFYASEVEGSRIGDADFTIAAQSDDKGINRILANASAPMIAKAYNATLKSLNSNAPSEPIEEQESEFQLNSLSPIEIELRNMPAEFRRSQIDPVDTVPVLRLQSEGPSVLSEEGSGNAPSSALRGGSVALALNAKPGERGWQLLSSAIRMSAGENGYVETVVGKVLTFASHLELSTTPDSERLVLASPAEVVVREKRLMSWLDELLGSLLSEGPRLRRTDDRAHESLRLISEGSIVMTHLKEEGNERVLLQMPSPLRVSIDAWPLEASRTGLAALREWRLHSKMEASPLLSLSAGSLRASVRRRGSDINLRTINATFGAPLDVRDPIRDARLSCGKADLILSDTSSELTLAGPVSLSGSERFLLLLSTLIGNQSIASVAEDYRGGIVLDAQGSIEVRDWREQANDAHSQFRIQTALPFQVTAIRPTRTTLASLIRGHRVAIDAFFGNRLDFRAERTATGANAIQKIVVSGGVSARFKGRRVAGERLNYDPVTEQAMLDGAELAFDLEESSTIRGVASVNVMPVEGVSGENERKGRIVFKGSKGGTIKLQLGSDPGAKRDRQRSGIEDE